MKTKVPYFDRLLDLLNHSLLIVSLFLFIYPLWFVIIASVSDPGAVWRGEAIFWPAGFTLEGYIEILHEAKIWRGYVNSIMYTVVGVLCNLFFTITCAYPLSRKDFLGRKVLTKIYLFTMLFSGGLIPTFLLVKQLRLLDNMFALILPSLVGVMNMIIVRTFFETNLPDELWEAARIDGCSNFRFLWSVVLPLSKAIIVVMALYYGVGHWNKFFDAMIYISSQNKFPLQIVLRDVVLRSQVLSADMSDALAGSDAATVARLLQLAEQIKYGIIVIACVPALVIYPFAQKYFIKGVMIGSVKG
jgi:putative aldouronate transport system permease protein